MKAFKQKCIALRQQDYTLDEIVKKTKRAKTSVYFHIKNIPLSNEKQVELATKHTERTIQQNLKRKGKSILNRHPVKFYVWTPSLVRLVGHLLFDGTINYSSCIYNNRSKALIENFKKDIFSVYKYKPIELLQESAVIRITYSNVELAHYLKQKAVELLKNIEQMPNKHQKVFLKAFFDDEGCIYFREKIRNVRGYQYNSSILELIQKLLLNFNIESKVDNRFHEITIGKRKNIERFSKEINFSRGIYVNGNRSNSRWKKHLEKREILRMALASYLN